MISQETWKEIRPVFARAYPNEAVVAVWPDGSWQEFRNVSPMPLKAFAIEPTEAAPLFNKRPLALIHSHCIVGEVGTLGDPSDPDSIEQLASGFPWGIVVVSGNPQGDVYGVESPVFWGDGVPRQPILGRKYQWVISDCFTLMRDYHATQGIHYPDVPRVRDAEVKDSEGNPYYPADHWAHRYMEHWIRELGFELVEDRADRKPGDAVVRRSGVSAHLDHCSVYLGEGKYLDISLKRPSHEYIPDDEESFWRVTGARFYRWKGRK